MTHFKQIPQLLAVIVCGMLWVACQSSVGDLGAPELIHVSEYELTVTPQQGTAQHRVEEVWVYSATDVLGVYPLPATVALPSGNPETLTLVPGIRANGIAATRRVYPFYEVNTVALDGDPATSIEHNFGGGYVDNESRQTVVLLAEDFESANRFVPGPSSNAEVIRITDEMEVFEGAGCGYIRLDSTQNQLSVSTNEQVYTPPRDRPVYLEFHYKCDVAFYVGLEVMGGSQAGRLPILGLNPTCDSEGNCVWNKIYLDLYPALSSMPDAQSFEIALNSTIPLDGSEGNIWVDNFKFVHFDD